MFSTFLTTFIKSPCEGIQTTNSSVYVWNSGYPYAMSPGADSCACAVEISCNSTIMITAIDLRLEDDDSSGACLQTIVVTENGGQVVIGCDRNNKFLETTVFSSTTDFVTFEISNLNTQVGGNFWIQVSGQDADSEVTLSCGPSSISQAQSNEKPVCGKTTTTIPTTTTGNLSSTTESLLNNSTTLSSINSSTTLSSINSSTTLNYINSSTTLSSINGSTTISSIDGNSSSTTVVSPNVNTTDDSRNGTGNTDSLLDTSTSSDNVSTITDDIGTTPDASASQQNSEAGSGFPVAIIATIAAILVIGIIGAVIFVWKRKWIKQRLCPNKVEDGDDNLMECDQPQYDTMPNPLLVDGALPLITGQAATSTRYPNLPGGGFIGKKSQLEPLPSAPKPTGDIFNLSSSLIYRLPAIDNIGTSLPRQKSSISGALLEEHQRYPFPDINEAESGTQSEETKKDRQTRKKKKRMMDRLNRIKLPTRDGRDTSFGFGASSQRF